MRWQRRGGENVLLLKTSSNGFFVVVSMEINGRCYFRWTQRIVFSYSFSIALLLNPNYFQIKEIGSHKFNFVLFFMLFLIPRYCVILNLFRLHQHRLTVPICNNIMTPFIIIMSRRKHGFSRISLFLSLSLYSSLSSVTSSRSSRLYTVSIQSCCR